MAQFPPTPLQSTKKREDACDRAMSVSEAKNIYPKCMIMYVFIFLILFILEEHV